ncbi:hypothetical protein [Microvirga sp. 17 mud 1-3]|uniref:hypothetical protein n=1 Tax=Microvirga sp. 17 mud 1-3 TaxID=2082949 RepID=UPI000D6D89EE|nr:hypothetical protein [Microvirga sp. 17 mud 1-3]AWM88272.1 hypothetical protein C4E04_16995 [Microvirga sp. 17 mud 1-3]
MLISAADAALLTAYNLHLKGLEMGKPLNRARASEKSIKRLATRQRLDGRFMEDYITELLALGWVAFWSGEVWGFQRCKPVNGWTNVNSKRAIDAVRTDGLSVALARARKALGLSDDLDFDIDDEKENDE